MKASKGESAHTPGPWSFEYNGSAGVNIYDSKRKIIATVEAYAPKPSKEAFATATLIAAAPETAAERDKLRVQVRELENEVSNLQHDYSIVSTERNNLLEQRDELLNFVRASVNFYSMCAEDVKGTGGLGTDEANFLIVGRELIQES